MIKKNIVKKFAVRSALPFLLLASYVAKAQNIDALVSNNAPAYSIAKNDSSSLETKQLDSILNKTSYFSHNFLFDSLVLVRRNFKDEKHPGDSVVAKYYGNLVYSILDTIAPSLLDQIGVKNLPKNGQKIGADFVKTRLGHTASSYATSTIDSVEVTQTDLKRLVANNCNQFKPAKATLIDKAVHVERLPDGSIVQGTDYVAIVEIDQLPREATLEDVLTKYNKVLDFTQSDSASSAPLADTNRQKLFSNWGVSVGVSSDLKSSPDYRFRISVPVAGNVYVFSGFVANDQVYQTKEERQNDFLPSTKTALFESCFDNVIESSRFQNNFLPAGVGYNLHKLALELGVVVGRDIKTDVSRILQTNIFRSTGEIVDKDVPVGHAQTKKEDNYKINEVTLGVKTYFGKKGIGTYLGGSFNLSTKQFQGEVGVTYNVPRNKLPWNKKNHSHRRGGRK